jgi:signal transduction histidine kinase
MRDLLDYGRTPAVAREPADIGEVVADAVTNMKAVADDRSVRITTDLAPDSGLVLVDRERLLQALENVLENAVHFSPAGGTISVALRRGSENGRAAVECVVMDEGPGFCPEDLPSVLEPFFTRRQGGTGLGLAITQRIVEDHGGRVLVANRPAGGARVVVVLPTVPSPPEPV